MANAVRLIALGWVLACSALGCRADTGGRNGPSSTVGDPAKSGNGKDSGSSQGAGASPSTSSGTGGTSTGGGATGSGGTQPVGSGMAGSSSGSGGGGAAPAMKQPFDAGTDPARNAVMPGNLCDRLATIQCAGEAACCDNPGRDFATCKADMMMGCTSQLMVDDIARQAAAGFDATQAEAVYTQLETLSANCDPGVAAFGIAPDGLRSMFRGTVAPGASCKPGNLLDKAQAGGALASCTMADGYACMPTLASWTCNAHGAAGAKCFTDINCREGLFCDNPNLAISGSTCMMRKTVGSACKQPNECDSLFCKGGMCVPADAQAAYCLKQ